MGASVSCDQSVMYINVESLYCTREANIVLFQLYFNKNNKKCKKKKKSHAGSAVLTFIKIRCFIQMYTKVLGVLHHLLARGPADNLRPSPCDSGQSTRTLIFPGVIILKTDATF